MLHFNFLAYNFFVKFRASLLKYAVASLVTVQKEGSLPSPTTLSARSAFTISEPDSLSVDFELETLGTKDNTHPTRLYKT